MKMAANKLRLHGLKLLRSNNIHNNYSASQKLLYCTTNIKNEASSTDKKSGFAKFSEKQDEFLQDKPQQDKSKSFVSLLRNSKFIDLGNPEGKQVIGEIYHIVGDDLYIDFGWKFPTICSRPNRNKEKYILGAKVKLLIKDLELASKFLGSDEEITLLEADCTLLGLVESRKTN